jgi:hypothetical protein
MSRTEVCELDIVRAQRSGYANRVCEQGMRTIPTLLSPERKKKQRICCVPPRQKKYALVLQAKRVAEKVRTRSTEISFLVFQPGSYIYVDMNTEYV